MLDKRDDLAELRREFVLVCGPEGHVLEADRCAEELVELKGGDELHRRLVEGSTAKLNEFLRRAEHGPTGEWELALAVNGAPIAVRLRGMPRQDGRLLIVGSPVPPDLDRALTQVREGMQELAHLHRRSESQQAELRRQNGELKRLNHELEDSARGMMALHDEVEEKAESLMQMAEVKARLVSNVSHEFRTPLNSILGLTRILLDEEDGPLSEEQKKQLNFILRSATSLTELADDVLDLTKLESGKMTLRLSSFRVDDLFSALRGMFRPLATNPDVRLEFVPPPDDLPVVETDENKLAQILKNLVTNALKFTVKGHVRIVAEQRGTAVHFTVEDSGIGIPAGEIERIFDEFHRVSHPIQETVKGTGLGLPLCRKLADMLEGRIRVTSTEGQGSSFVLEIPMVHSEAQMMRELESEAENLDPSRSPILVVEDDRQTLFLYERYLRNSGFQVVPARTVAGAREALTRLRPSAIVLDVMLEGDSTWTFLQELKSEAATRDIPVLVVTVMNGEHQARALGADEFFVKPLNEEQLRRRLERLARVRGPVERVLVIDDDEVARYLVRKMLADDSLRIIEARTAAEGISAARRERPHVILLDFILQSETAFDVLDELKVDPQTRNIPVLIQTSKDLTDDERRRLAKDTASIIPKRNLSREVAMARIREALMQSEVGRPHMRKP